MGNRDLVEVTVPELRVGDRDGSLMPGRRIVSLRDLDDGRRELTLQWSNGRTDKARVDPERTFRVKRVVVGPGMPVRYRGRAKATRGQVEVLDTAHPDTAVTASEVHGHRWAMRCEHGTVIGRATLQRALDDVLDPRLWCVDCVDRGPRAQLLLPL